MEVPTISGIALGSPGHFPGIKGSWNFNRFIALRVMCALWAQFPGRGIQFPVPTNAYDRCTKTKVHK